MVVPVLGGDHQAERQLVIHDIAASRTCTSLVVAMMALWLLGACTSLFVTTTTMITTMTTTFEGFQGIRAGIWAGASACAVATAKELTSAGILLLILPDGSTIVFDALGVSAAPVAPVIKCTISTDKSF